MNIFLALIRHAGDYGTLSFYAVADIAMFHKLDLFRPQHAVNNLKYIELFHT